MPQKGESDVIEKRAGPTRSVEPRARISSNNDRTTEAPGLPADESQTTSKAQNGAKASVRSIISKEGDASINYVRRVVAGNPNTPLTVLSRLADDECYPIRRTVAGNPKTPVELLTKLSMDDCPEVRLGVAENPHTPPQTLALLADDSAIDVRYGIAEIPHMPEDILLKLARDENPYVRNRALKTLQMLV
jgi:hypothetical protein